MVLKVTDGEITHHSDPKIEKMCQTHFKPTSDTSSFSMAACYSKSFMVTSKFYKINMQQIFESDLAPNWYGC